MLTIDQALTAMCDALAAALPEGATIIKARWDATRPPSPYYTVDLLDDREVGHPQTVGIEDGAVSLITRSEVRYRIDGYGSATGDALQRFRSVIRSRDTEIATDLWAAGVAPQRTRGPRRTSAPYQTGQEPRYSLEIDAHISLVVEADVGWGEADGIVVDLAGEGAVVIEYEAAIVVPDDLDLTPEPPEP